MYSFNFPFFDTSPTLGVGGWGYTHVALFMYTVFHINLFQLEYYVSVRYNRADITSSLMNVMHVALQTRGKIHFLEHSDIIVVSFEIFNGHK